MGKTIILECLMVGEKGDGSEAGTGRAWVETLLNRKDIDKIHLITSSIKTPPKNEKLKTIIVPEKGISARILYSINNILGKKINIAMFIYHLNYILWLLKSKKIAVEVAKKEHIDLAIHGSFCVQITYLTALKNMGIPVLCHGTIPPWPGKLLTIIRRTPSFITTPKPNLQKGEIFLRDPHFPPSITPLPTEKKERCMLYIDHYGRRKNAINLRNELLEIKKEGGKIPPITIVTKREEWWAEFKNSIKIIEKLPKKEFLEILNKHSHILNTSICESTCTSIMEAITLNTKAITYDCITPGIPSGWLIKKTKRIDKTWEEEKDKPMPRMFNAKILFGEDALNKVLDTVLSTINNSEK